MKPDGGADPLAARGLCRVVFPPTEVADVLALLTHIDDVARELQLIQIDGLGSELPVHISTLAEALTRGKARMRNEIRRQVMSAREAGAAEFRLELDLPAHAELVVRAVSDLLDQTDRCSDVGLLLTPVAPVGARRALRIMGDHLRAARREPTTK